MKAVSIWPVVAALAVGWPAASCAGRDCAAYAAFGLVITVQDQSGLRICDAAVTATDGKYSDTLEPFDPNPEVCTYQGALERRGTYAVTVHAQGRTSTQRNVEVHADECHVIPTRLTIVI